MTPGERIGKKYRLTHQIGEGAMGVVWAAVNEATSGEVALKLILRSNEDLRHRLRREARAAGKLRHPNIIEIYDIGETVEGDPFLVMPLLSGETLSELLARQRRLDPPAAARIARDVARALDAAHAGQVIHRDLKPANVFLHQEMYAEAPVVKVLDFGVSKNLEMLDGFNTMAGRAVGSPAYMSPEQAQVERTLDHRADLWSLGVVLFEMLTGVRPFQGDENKRFPQLVAGEMPLVSRLVRHVDPALVTLVSRCLERDRDKRIGSAAELAAELTRFVSPGPAPSPGPPCCPARAVSALDLANLESTAPLTGAPGSAPSAATAGPSMLEADAASFAITTRIGVDKMAAMLGPKPPAPLARRKEVPAPSRSSFAVTAPFSDREQAAAPAPRFGSAPLLPLLNGHPHGTERLGAGAPPVTWQPAPGHRGLGSIGAATESANRLIARDGVAIMPSGCKVPAPRFGAAPAPAPSTAALKARRRTLLSLVTGAGVIALILLSLGLNRGCSTATANPANEKQVGIGR
jgi:eukaryotic-like serine/threonine-protein kinase